MVGTVEQHLRVFLTCNLSRTIERSVYEPAEADLTSLLQHLGKTNAAIDMVVLLNAKPLHDKL